jgi:GAF domain-containing protein
MVNSMDKKLLFKTLYIEIKAILDGEANTNDKLLTICKILKGNIEYYDWVGFYLVNPSIPNELFLGPYEGDPTEHIRIHYGDGICGQAAVLKETFLVQDVSEETNYLSCSPKVKSEIVVPIFSEGEIVGEIDIDSHSVSPFSNEDQVFLEEVAKLVATLFII